MDVMVMLERNLQEMRNNLEKFQVGAAVPSDEASIEHKIQNLKDTLKLFNSREFLFKARDYERKVLVNTQTPIDIENGLLLSLNEFEEEYSKVILQELAWKSTIAASVTQEILAKDSLPEYIYTSKSQYGDIHKTLRKLLMQQCERYAALKVATKKLSNKMCQVSEKKLPLLNELQQFKMLLMAQEEEFRRRAREKENNKHRMKEHLKKRLQKINTMRMLTANLLACGEVDFTPPSRWTDLVFNVRKPITLNNLSN